MLDSLLSYKENIDIEILAKMLSIVIQFSQLECQAQL